ncbi:MAG: CopG family transcriptional regulator [Chloroflexi bacterium]|nr:CopG family transcriptional regulator [Chloroflexota bacterium]
MSITLRLDPELLAQLDRAAQCLGMTRSDVLRAAIREYCERTLDGHQTAYEKMKDLIGSVEGPPDLSTNPDKYLWQPLPRAPRDPR